jgi:hypothetical protein
MRFATLTTIAAALVLAGELALAVDASAAVVGGDLRSSAAGGVSTNVEPVQMQATRCFNRTRRHYLGRCWHTDLVRCCRSKYGAPRCTVLRHYRDRHCPR